MTYTWTNSGTYAGTPRAGTVAATSASTATPNLATLTTPTLANAIQPAGTFAAGNWISGLIPANTFGVLPVLDDTNGVTAATVTVTDGYGESTTASVSVQATSFQGSTHNVAVGSRVFLNAGQWTAATIPVEPPFPTDGGALLIPDGGSWSLTPASGSALTSTSFDNVNSQFASFVPDKTGAYVATLTIPGGARGGAERNHLCERWYGAIDTQATTADAGVNGFVPFEGNTNCIGCHNSGQNGLTPSAIDEFTPWLGTKHAVHLTFALEGITGFSSGSSCLACHSVGFDTGNTLAGGFSVVQAADGLDLSDHARPERLDQHAGRAAAAVQHPVRELPRTAGRHER